MTRSRLASRAGRWGLPLVLLLSGGPVAHAQPAAETVQPAPSVPTAVADSAATAAVSAPSFSWLWVLLGGVALGVLGARFWARSSARRAPANATAEPEPAPPRKAENAPKTPVVQSLRQVQGNPAASAAPAKTLPKPSETGGKNKQKPKSGPSSGRSGSWPVNVPHRPAAMPPTQPPAPPAATDQPLEPGQTMEWNAPTATPPAIQELIDSTAAAGEASPSTAPFEAAAPAGPVHYYAPAPDVPSIEHRKLSPSPLPQMPLLVTLPHAEATTAQFSFSPQADQSRIIGNGVRELKEFFAFELPPTEQFTAIQNLAAGQLEKRDDTWYVVQKAEIALN